MVSTELASAMLWWTLVLDLLCFVVFTVLSGSRAGTLLLVPFMFFGLAVIVSSVLTDDCWSPAAYLASISGICASIYQQGYAFMMVALTTVATVFLTRINDVIQRCHENRNVSIDIVSVYCGFFERWKVKHTLTDLSMSVSCVLVVLTGIIPDNAHNCQSGDDGEG